MIESLPEFKAIVTDTNRHLKAGTNGITAVLPDVRLHEADADCAVVSGCAIPSDPDFNLQWYMEYGSQTTPPNGSGEEGDDIDIARGWALDQGSSQVTIAIVDTGIDPSQPDLASRITGNWAIPEDGSDTSDVSGHGTAVAGIAAASANNGIGISGVAPNADILNIKVTTARHPDTETCSALANGIVTATKDGAKVINVSSGSNTPCILEKEAVAYAWNAGSLVVAAAGNYGSTEPFYPAAYEHVISVASTDAYDRPATFANGDSTNVGASWVDLAAPGVGIFTTLPTYPNSFGAENYGYVDGTSFSAPMVSGAAALLFAEGLSNSAVETRLLERANPIKGTGTDWKYGMLDVCAAIANSESSCPQITPTAPIVLAPPKVVVNIIYPSGTGQTPTPSEKSAVKPPAPRRLTQSVYRGYTSQRVPITLRVGSDGSIAALSFSYRQDCGKRGGSLLARASNTTKTHMASLAYAGGTWNFRAEAIGPARQSFEVLGRFSAHGVSGSVVPHLHGVSCDPDLSWSATR